MRADKRRRKPERADKPTGGRRAEMRRSAHAQEDEDQGRAQQVQAQAVYRGEVQLESAL
jgi:hypothetical protein